jgi:spore maturation protein CgeB
MRIVILGLAISSPCQDSHGAVYGPLVKGMVRRGHDVLFLEPATSAHAAGTPAQVCAVAGSARRAAGVSPAGNIQPVGLPKLPAGDVQSYSGLAELKDRWTGKIASADVIIVGSGLDDGIEIGKWVMQSMGRRAVAAFYDIDAPATMSQLSAGSCQYISPELAARYDAYFCCSGGPLLKRIASRFGARRVVPLYRAVDEEQYFFQPAQAKWDMGHLAAYSRQRQETLDRLMLQVARPWPHGRFLVAGPGYPKSLRWPDNVKLADAMAPRQRLESYNSQRFALNISNSPDAPCQSVSLSAGLLEAAACSTPIISDWWHGIGCFFEPGSEILVAVDSQQVLYYLRRLSPQYAAQIGRRARQRVLANHTANIRAAQLEDCLMEMLQERAPASAARQPRGMDRPGPTSFDSAA